MIKAPPSPLTQGDILSLSKGTTLHRIHSSSFGFADFNPCKGGQTRFAPILDRSGNCVPSLYAGATSRAAFHESIFHDIPATARTKTVRLQDILRIMHSQLKTLRKLKLVQLRSASLGAWGISRRELIESNAKLYHQTVLWAQEIHRSFPAADGIVWTSRQCDPDDAYLFFGDRVQTTDFAQIGSRPGTDSTLISEVRDEGKRRGITIII